jgi:hypothetical protein
LFSCALARLSASDCPLWAATSSSDSSSDEISATLLAVVEGVPAGAGAYVVFVGEPEYGSTKSAMIYVAWLLPLNAHHAAGNGVSRKRVRVAIACSMQP